MKKHVLGIAGFIGSGKSTVGEYLQKKGAYFIDADKVVDDLYLPGREGYLKIVNYFGEDYVTKAGLINRAKLAKFVFGDPNKLKILNYLIHPLVVNEIHKIIDAVDEEFFVVEATYFEAKHLGKLVNALLWIECDREILKKRALKNKGLNAQIFERILRSQIKPEKVDYVIANRGTKTELYKQLDEVWQKFCSKGL